MTAFDHQKGEGDHYTRLGDHQPWKVLASWLSDEELQGFAKGTAVAYLAREKHGREDIEKAMHTLQLYLEITQDRPEKQSRVEALERELRLVRECNAQLSKHNVQLQTQLKASVVDAEKHVTSGFASQAAGNFRPGQWSPYHPKPTPCGDASRVDQINQGKYGSIQQPTDFDDWKF